MFWNKTLLLCRIVFPLATWCVFVFMKERREMPVVSFSELGASLGISHCL